MWYKNNYRRNLLDMHIDDWNPAFLSKLNSAEYADALSAAGMQAVMVKSKSHTGLCYYPTSVGRMHRGLKGHDYLGEIIELCHKKDIKVVVYYSQIFDNWAYEEHPEWRCITSEGKNFREKLNGTKLDFKNGRYGIVCPNNPGYRDYVKVNLQELNRNYDFEGMFLDMTFFPDVCYCGHCRERYLKETGRELPRIINWEDPDFLEFQHIREMWIRDFALFSTNCVKEIKPEVTIEHQSATVTSSWINASSEYLMDAAEFASGDYYGGFLQQTFISKYYRNVSANLPFLYHTSRCDPELAFHTTTKTQEELMLHVFTALVHEGAFLLVDAINPDGTIVPEVYHKLMKSVFAQTSPYEPYAGGNLLANVSIWFASHAKYDPGESGIPIEKKAIVSRYYMESPLQAAAILRENNLPFDVIGSRNLADCRTKLLLLPHVACIRDDEMKELEAFIERGGNLYVSGPIGHPRLAELLGVRVIGKTPHDFTYMSPTEQGTEIFAGFSSLAPVSVTMPQILVERVSFDSDVLATLVLPYTLTDDGTFSAIHSNPPGEWTDYPSVISRQVGNGRILWAAAPLEMMNPYMTRSAVAEIFRTLSGCPLFYTNAPKEVEVLGWEKEEKTYYALINQQERPPVTPYRDLYLDIPGKDRILRLPVENITLQTENIGECTRVYLPKLELFLLLEVE